LEILSTEFGTSWQTLKHEWAAALSSLYIFFLGSIGGNKQ
jgi:hypothetical protein